MADNELATLDQFGDLDALDLNPTQVVAVEAITRAEIDIMVSTAKRYPRSIKRFIAQSETLACLTPEVAAGCSYAKPTGQKFLIGPSIRLAEIMAPAWGNLNVGARIIEENGRFVVAQGVAIDYETNYRETSEVRRRITDKNGRTYSDDMIVNTSNAACSIAFRNAVFRIIPRSVVEQVRLKAVNVANGGQSVQELVSKLLAHFAGIGVDDKRVCLAVGARGREDLTLEHVETLRAVATAIRDGETTADGAFPKVNADGVAGAPVSRTDALASRLDEAKPKAK